MTIENPLYDTSIGGTQAKSRVAKETEYRTFKAVKSVFKFAEMALFAIIRMGHDMIKEVIRPGSSSRL
jgi:hypothetical protein